MSTLDLAILKKAISKVKPYCEHCGEVLEKSHDVKKCLHVKEWARLKKKDKIWVKLSPNCDYVLTHFNNKLRVVRQNESLLTNKSHWGHTTICAIRVVDPDGNLWYGRGFPRHTLHIYKAKSKLREIKDETL